MYDVIVCGLGANGSAALFQLSQKPGLRVLGLEAKTVAHREGGSFGETRLLRRSYFEDPSYIPLVTESLELWQRLQRRASVELIRETGLVFAGPKGEEIFKKIRTYADHFGFSIESLEREVACLKFPFLRIPETFEVAFERDASVLFPSKILPYFVSEAARNPNVEVRTETPVERIRWDGTGVRIDTLQESFRAKKLLLTVGGWTKGLLADLDLPIELRESPQFWFHESAIPSAKITTPFALPLGNEFVYGFPDFGSGVKMASYNPGRVLKSPDERSPASAHGLDVVQDSIKKFFPGVEFKPKAQHTCFFDLGTGENIILDFHPKCQDIVFIAAGSGHGFKMAPGLARAAIEMLETGSYGSTTEFLKISRTIVP